MFGLFFRLFTNFVQNWGFYPGCQRVNDINIYNGTVFYAITKEPFLLSIDNQGGKSHLAQRAQFSESEGSIIQAESPSVP